jgi:hypothetical protein
LEKPIFIAGIPCNENRFFPMWENFSEKTLFQSCNDPVRDYSLGYSISLEFKKKSCLINSTPLLGNLLQHCLPTQNWPKNATNDISI